MPLFVGFLSGLVFVMPVGPATLSIVGIGTERGRRAEAAGIPRQRIMLDAGLDLGKTPSMSADLLRHSGDLTVLGYPILLSASIKGFLGAPVGTEIGRAHV